MINAELAGRIIAEASGLDAGYADFYGKPHEVTSLIEKVAVIALAERELREAQTDPERPPYDPDVSVLLHLADGTFRDLYGDSGKPGRRSDDEIFAAYMHIADFVEEHLQRRFRPWAGRDIHGVAESRDGDAVFYEGICLAADIALDEEGVRLRRAVERAKTHHLIEHPRGPRPRKKGGANST